MAHAQPLDDAQLAELLQDVARSPGRYALRRGEPQELFAAFDTLVQWALGRFDPALAQSQAASLHDLSAAATLFVQRACFAAGSTHYQVLGFTAQNFDAALLRSRYRALIRLTHPDMGVAGFPSNAASMVNRAQEVLANTAQRQAYDAQLRRAEAPPPSNVPPNAPHSPPYAHAQSEHGRRGPAAVLEPQGSLQTRWAALLAQYPGLVRKAVVALAVMVLAGGFLMWAVQDSSSSSVLVVARPSDKQPAPAPDTLAQPPIQAAAAASAATPSPSEPVAPVPEQPAQTVYQTASQAALHSGAKWVVDTPDKLPETLAHQASEVLPQKAAERVSKKAVEKSTLQPARQTVAELPTPAPVPAPPVSLPVTVVQPYYQPEPELVPVSAPEPVAVTEPNPVVEAEVQLFPVPMPEPTVTVWSVDAGAARQYANDILRTLDSDEAAVRHIQSYLTKMNVKGSLLQPALELLRSHPVLQMQQSAWSERARPGVLELHTMIVLQADGAETPAHFFRVRMEFYGAEEGTVLERLDVRPQH